MFLSARSSVLRSAFVKGERFENETLERVKSETRMKEYEEALS